MVTPDVDEALYLSMDRHDDERTCGARRRSLTVL
jgi:hypothetical protein